MVADATKTVFATVTVTASSTPTFTLSAEDTAKINHSGFIAQWTAIAVLSAYVLFALCLLSIYTYRRIGRKPEYVSLGLPPEATQHGKGTFLPRRQGARRGTSASTWSTVSTETRRSMFYEGPGTPVASYSRIELNDSPPSPPRTRPTSGRYERRYSSSRSNLIPLQTSPKHTSPAPPVPPLPPKIAIDAVETTIQDSTRPGTGRSRSSSQSTLRYYVLDREADPMPKLPTLALVGSNQWR